MVLRDSDLRKWDYPLHTRAKHQVLEHYMKAWLTILSRGAHRARRLANLTIVDGFAVRGRYNDGSEGSPLIFRRLARDVVRYC